MWRRRQELEGGARPFAALVAPWLASTALSTALLAGLLSGPAGASGGKEGDPAAEPAKGGVNVVGADSLGKPGKSDEEVILEVYMRRQDKLSGGIISYIRGEDVLVPLQELMILLEFAIQETPQGAAGWFIAEDRRFVLNVKEGTVLSAGKTYKIAAAATGRFDNQLYVSARGLSQWLPLDFHANLRAMQLVVNPREVTPKEERAARNKDKKYGSIHQFRSELPKHETPYAFIQVPALEVDTAIGYTSRRGGSTYGAGTVRAFGDLFFMSGELMVVSSDRGVSDARLRLGRYDPDGGLLGPLNATAFELGDVSGTTVPLVSAGLSGRGLHVSSRPYGYVAEFDRVTVEEAVEAGYEVELYRNNILMASQPPTNTGRVRFDNIPLLRGANEIRLEFYGPQGQRRTETRQFFVGDLQVPVGKFNYDVTLHEVGRSVFGFSNWLRYNKQYENSAFGGSARFDYGLTRNLSVSAGLVAAPLPDRYRRDLWGDDYRYYGTLGARTMIGNFSIGVDTAVDDTGGVAAGLSAQTQVDGWTVSGRHEQFMNGFASDTAFGASQVLRDYAYRTSNSTLRADKQFPAIMHGVYLSFGVVGGYTTFENLEPSWRVGTSMGVTAGRFSLTNDLYYGGALVAGNEGLFGSIRGNYRLFDGLSLRASADYDLRDNAEVDGYSAGLTAQLPYDVTFGLGYATRYDRYRDLERTDNYYATLRRRFGIAEVGLLAGYGRFDAKENYDRRDRREYEDDYRVALTVSFSTFTDPANFATAMSADRIARQGAIRPRPFYDTNQNGVRDPDEKLLEGVGVVYAGQREPYVSGGDNWKPPAGPVGTGAWTDVAIDRARMPDSTMSPGSRGRSVLPRPGVVSTVDLPVVAKAGIEGRVDLSLGKEARALPNVKVQVVRKDAGGEEKVVAETSTEFDGVFSLADVPIGDYVIRVEPEQARQIGAKKPIERQITLTPDTGVLDGVALKVERAS